MSRVRSRGNASTELYLASLLRRSSAHGWRRHMSLVGRPDFAFLGQRVAIFVDGCFWHKCPKCYRQPKSRKAFWIEKIRVNRARDRRVNKMLRAKGWKVIRIWECDLKRNPSRCIKRIIRAIATSNPDGARLRRDR
ncbi:very short patch repair endonuclease [Pedosphaera parvula]|uniref:very short patch repair endonuclease n=1 Tax=Pedosphaera parvula TaxID=1032527 RepID=UPI00192CE293|nr:very short patch repair endonuclease [Pedosphaera parvula]